MWALISRDVGHAFHAIVGSHFMIMGRRPTFSWSQAGSVQMTLNSLGQLRAKLLHPSERCRSVNIQAPLGQQIRHILVGQRIPHVHPHRAQDYDGWKPMAFGWLFA